MPTISTPQLRAPFYEPGQVFTPPQKALVEEKTGSAFEQALEGPSEKERLKDKSLADIHKFMAESIRAAGQATAMSEGKDNSLMPMIENMTRMLQMENDAKKGDEMTALREQSQHMEELIRAGVTSGLVDRWVQVENGRVVKTEEDSKPKVRYDMPHNVQRAHLIVTDEHDKIMRITPLDTRRTGENLELEWDGEQYVHGENGYKITPAPKGNYKLSIVGQTVDGTEVPLPVYTAQKVTSAQLPIDGRAALVTVDGVSVPLDQIRALQAV